VNLLSLIFTGILIVFVIIFIVSTVKIIRQAELAIVERVGKYNRKIDPGLHFIIPIIERVAHRIDMRTQVMESPSQSVITKDNVGVEINTVTWFRVVDPSKSVYEIEDLQHSVLNIIATTLRDVIGQMELDNTYSSREIVNTKLGIALDEATSNWGIKVERVEVKDINPPAGIKDAMEKQMKAERERRESVLRAQGQKESQILEAEGLKESAILKATAEKESQVLFASGEAEAIRMIAEAERNRILQVYGAYNEVEISKESLELQNILSLREIAKSNNKMIIPYESTALMGAIAQLAEGKKFSNSTNKEE
jgi:regulator of protease activity HflC (stomatin/prohibitin superfamily)